MKRLPLLGLASLTAILVVGLLAPASVFAQSSDQTPGKRYVEVIAATPEAPATTPEIGPADNPTLHRYASTGGGLAVQFPHQSTAPVLVAGEDGVEIGFVPTALQFRDAAGVVIDSQAPLASNAVAPGNGTVVYPGAWPGADDVFTPQPGRIKHDVVIHTMPAIGEDVDHVGFAYRVTVPAGLRMNVSEAMVMPVGRVPMLVDDKGSVRFLFGDVIVIDANGAEVAGRYRVAPTADGWDVVLEVPAAWLRSAACPVTVDPTVDVSSGASNNAIPFDDGWNNPEGAMQTYYTPVQLQNESGEITGIAVRVILRNSQAATYAQMQILMGESSLPRDSMTTTYANNYNAVSPTVVFDNQIFFPATPIGSWIPITLETPFNYSGTNNLVVEFRIYDPPTPLPADVIVEFGAINRRFWTGSQTITAVAEGSDNNGYTMRFEFTDAPVLPTITSPAAGALADGYVGNAYSVTFNGAGGQTPYAWSHTGNLPPGLSLDPDSGQLSGNPTTAGNYSFTIILTDNNNDTDQADYTIDIYDPPTIDSPSPGALQEGTENAPTAYPLSPITFSGSNGKSPLSWSATGLPPGVLLNSSTGVLSGTPTAAGDYNVTVTLSDANNETDSEAYTIRINSPVTVTTSSLPNGEETKGYSVTATASGGTSPITWQINITPSLSTITINSSTGEISGTPAPGESGTYSVTITATDAYSSSSTSASLTLVIDATAGSIGGAGGGCSCSAVDASDARQLDLQGLALLACLLALAVVRRRMS